MKQKFYSAFWLKHLGVYYMLVASFYFALNGALAKVMAERMSSAEIVFFRNVVGIAIVLFSLRRVKNLGPLTSILAPLLPSKRRRPFSPRYFRRFS